MAREFLRAARCASDIRVVVNDRRSHIVALEVEPASYYGPGLHRPFGSWGRRGSALSDPRPVRATVTVNGDGGGGTGRTGQQLGDVDDLERVRGVA